LIEGKSVKSFLRFYQISYQLLLSGLMPDDETYIIKSLKDFPFSLFKKTEKDGWLCLLFG